jgi:ubiquinone biosynthesis protein UbiJ
MATQSPFSFAQNVFANGPSALTPPNWAIDELQRRVVLALNHVLMQEPQAMARLAQQKGRVLKVQWMQWHLQLRISPAGLFEHVPLGADGGAVDLQLSLTATNPWQVLQPLLDGGKPDVQVQGDVQLAADINWLIDHVRWDIEADLARMVGDVPAHMLVDGVQAMVRALRQFAGSVRRPGSAGMAGGTSTESAA